VTPADVAIGLALTAFGLLITFDSPSGQEGLWLDSVVIPAATLPVIWRRRAAVGAAAALAAGVVVSGIPTFDQIRCGVAIPAALLILYALGVHSDRRRSIAGLLLVLGRWSSRSRRPSCTSIAIHTATTGCTGSSTRSSWPAASASTGSAGG
jgi:hypothetical protein